VEKNLYKNIILKDNINFDNKKVLIMGLGLNGGGVGTCKFLARNGAKLIVTDLKKKEELKINNFSFCNSKKNRLKVGSFYLIKSIFLALI